MLVFGQAPFIASLFRPFALLPYAWAYVAWLGFSAGLLSPALALLFRTLGLNAEDRKTGFLLALSCDAVSVRNLDRRTNVGGGLLHLGAVLLVSRK